jgi:hypothetical protein
MPKENGVALVLSDSALLPPVCETTADFAYIIWEGNRERIKGTFGRVEEEKTNSISDWAEKMKGFLENSRTFWLFWQILFRTSSYRCQTTPRISGRLACMPILHHDGYCASRRL